MSLDNAIEHGDEHRKPFRGSKMIDATCRCHGSCAYCRGNRTHKNKRNEPLPDDDEEFMNEIDEEIS